MAWALRLWHLLYGHRHLQRVTVDGVRCFRCACGYQVPQIQRSPAELQRVRAVLRVVRPSAADAPRPPSAPAPPAAADGEGGEGSPARAIV